ncbi:MAG: hypothetical protein WB677_23615 [Xanthobacteraceae bacterium]
MEFGQPHIAVREPVVASPGRSDRVRRDLGRRRVFVVGDWHLWIQYSNWKVSFAGYSVDNRNADLRSNECLLDLEGQRLVSVEPGPLANAWAFAFDLGGTLEIWSSAEYAASDDLWSLQRWNDDIAALRGDGTLVFEKPQ